MTLRPLPLFPLFLLGLLAACDPVDIGDGSDDDSAVDPCDPCADDDDSTPTGDDDTDEPADEWFSYVEADGFVVSFDDAGFSDDVYLADAYVLGYGGDLGYNLNVRVSNSSGRFEVNTSSWDRDCYDSSLISSLEALDNGTYDEISSWEETADWWDNHQFCTSDSPTAATWCHNEGNQNYFVSFCVTDAGVVPNGD
ncbi:MAG: hypothetical protein AAB413_02580 [Patescibacteria group bacterium]